MTTLFATVRDAARERAWAHLLNRAAPGIIIALILTLAASITIGEWRDGGIGPRRPSDVRAVVFAPQNNGTLLVQLSTADGARHDVTLPSASEGFVATLAKSLGRERRRFDVAETLPYRLTRYDNGRLTLQDPLLGTDIRLEAFGSTNAASFATLLSAPRTSP